TASESAMRGRQIVEEHALKLMEEDKSENPRNVPTKYASFKNMIKLIWDGFWGIG
ncbi:hypothetical protein D1BOALGB6SA_9938, partial [Olavius sp. associated proteobacterium Delta 1]